MRTVSIDPSSSCSGVAYFEDEKLVRVESVKYNAELQKIDLPDASGVPSETYHKYKTLTDKIIKNITDFKPNHVVIEITSGKVNKGRHFGGGSGLSKYGMFIGFLWGRLLELGFCVHDVLENDWTRSSSKESRQLVARQLFKAVYTSKDTGMDESDAIMLGLWWIKKFKFETQTRQQPKQEKQR